ncbi:MAG: protein kinase [Acidobacteria bacterium]|nr:protein kinase [Acidobacteriota bacterium]
MDQWPEIEEAFLRALELEPEAREAFLKEKLADRSQRDWVVSMLRAHESDFMLSPVSIHEVAPQIPGYQMGELIGQGGMGSVYQATREVGTTTQEVAVKVIHLGLTSAVTRKRFELEQQILAKCQHPYIATLFDAGLSPETHVPYFVMERIHGMTLREWLNQQTHMLDQRLGLFLKICEAVSYAHQHLIIHRDIKPENILVTPNDVPKILDFGVAKLIEEEPQQGSLTQIPLGPFSVGYAAPEQLKGEPLTTAVDVYALGLVLFEMLTGSRPFPSTTSPSARLVALEGGAPLASQSQITTGIRSSHLKRDLDRIINLALQPDPKHRYATVQALMTDLTCFQQGRALQYAVSRPMDNLLKLLKRNYRSAVVVMGLWLMVLVAGMVSGWQGLRLKNQSKIILENAARIERESKRASAAMDFLVDLFESDDPYQTKEPQLDNILDRGRDLWVARFREQPDLQLVMAGLLTRVETNRGKYDRASDLLKQAQWALSQIPTPSAQQTSQVALLEGQLCFKQGQYKEAEVAYHQVIAVKEPALIPRAKVELADLYLHQGKLEHAASLVEEAFQAMHAQPDDPQLQATAMSVKMGVLINQGHHQQVLDMGDRALAQTESAFGQGSVRWVRVANLLAVAHEKLGHNQVALGLLEQCLASALSTLGEDHPTCWILAGNLSVSLYKMERFAESIPYGETCFQKHLDELGADHPYTVIYKANLAAQLAYCGITERAIPMLEEVVAYNSTNYGATNIYTALDQKNLAFALQQAGKMDRSMEVLGEAIPVFEAESHLRYLFDALLLKAKAMLRTDQNATPVLETLHEERFSELITGINRAKTQLIQAEAALHDGDLNTCEQVLKQLEWDVLGTVERAQAQFLSAEVSAQRGDYEQARHLLTKAHTLLESKLPHHPLLDEIHNALGKIK